MISGIFITALVCFHTHTHRWMRSSQVIWRYMCVGKLNSVGLPTSQSGYMKHGIAVHEKIPSQTLPKPAFGIGVTVVIKLLMRCVMFWCIPTFLYCYIYLPFSCWQSLHWHEASTWSDLWCVSWILWGCVLHPLWIILLQWHDVSNWHTAIQLWKITNGYRFHQHTVMAEFQATP